MMCSHTYSYKILDEALVLGLCWCECAHAALQSLTVCVWSSRTHIVHIVWFEAVRLAPHVFLLSVSYHLLLSPPPLLLVPTDTKAIKLSESFLSYISIHLIVTHPVYTFC